LDSYIRLETRNELLSERIAFLEQSLFELERRYRHFRFRHQNCKNPMILYR